MSLIDWSLTWPHPQQEQENATHAGDVTNGDREDLVTWQDHQTLTGRFGPSFSTIQVKCG